MIKKLLLLLLVLVSVSACSANLNENKLTGNLSYLERDNLTKVVFTETTLETSSYEDAIEKLFGKLCHPSDNSLVSAVPKSIHLLDSSFKDGVCSLTLSPTYNKLPPDERVALNFALMKTMLSLPNAKALSVTCDGRTVTFTESSFISEAPQTYYNSYLANLYFVNSDYTDATLLRRSVSLSGEKGLERSVIELLMSDSGTDSAISPFPKGTVLNDVYLDGGTCIVDVSSKFITAAKHSKEQETTILFSIVNTLTELPKIDSVKFLINGSDGFGYIYYDISAPLTNSKELFED